MSSIQTAVESFREAAIFPDRWPAALDLVASSLCSDGATLVLTPTRAHLVASSTALQPFVQQHFSLPFPDPREQRVSPRLNEGFKADHAYFSPREIAREPYYQEFLVPRGYGWNAAAALGGDLLISLKRGVKRGPYDAGDLAALDSALPWLRSASRVASMTWRSNFSGQLSVLERIGRGAILVDARARILEINACVRFGDGLDVAGGALHVPRLADQLRLQRFLAAAINQGMPARASHTMLTLPRPSGLRPWLLDAIACNDAMRSLHSHAAALVLITDIERPARLSHNLLSEVFGLTPTEAKLACAIVSGKSLQQAAVTLAISEGHARQRLKAVCYKTGTSRQVELVALLAKLI